MTEKRTVELDPDDQAQMEALVRGMYPTADWRPSALAGYAQMVAKAIRSLRPEPPMPEPEGDCIVVDSSGRTWSREDGDAAHIWCDGKVVRNWNTLLEYRGPLTVYRPEVQG